MLEEINIKNYALIDSLSLSFQKGFNVLTGETGAGKSIIVGSLSFLLGGKTDGGVIRTGADEASVSAVASIGTGNREAFDWLASKDIECEESQVIIRRSIKSSGRSAIYIQNAPVTRADLAEFMALLFDLHGQHSHETLMHGENHRKYLDGFAHLEHEALDFNRMFLELAGKRKILETQAGMEKDRETKIEMLQYAVDEITAANPQKGEIQELENESSRLGDFEKLTGYVNNAAEAFFDGGDSVLTLARRARTCLENASDIDGSLSTLLKRVEDMFYEAEDIAEEFRNYRYLLSYDPERLEEVEGRLNVLLKLKKKYGGGNAGLFNDEDGILAYKEKAEADIEALSRIEENRDKLKMEIAALEKDIASRATALSGKRKDAARELSGKITGILTHLGMPHARFEVEVASKGESGLVCGPWGADNIGFLISANAGEPLKELSRIASGGELSRVMLAIKTVLSDADTLETLVFDEIDTGIGGEVAVAVGEYLAKIGSMKQIFCVTHLASIAVRADNHLKVEKRSEAGRTFTGVAPLNAEERRGEIARMLGGDAGAAALAHADEMLAKYGKGVHDVRRQKAAISG
ncbi:MAG: DNA repair protein RecN [Treponema sp.]|jgi:DNA repair protein RecN (Recombination protein N)|nr:DNA repair protein RecN [Treponema sp.]